MNNTICAADDYNDERYLLKVVPSVIFKTRVRDESIEGPNPYRWEDVTTFDLFANKRVVLFSLPGAFTPTCSTYQLPGLKKSSLSLRHLVSRTFIVFLLTTLSL